MGDRASVPRGVAGGVSREKLVKSRQRVADHGEVFTPRWLVEDMLETVRAETERIDSRFLEPACGSGNFLVPVLERKLASVRRKHGGSAFELRHYSLFGLMCLYGVELLPDNAEECRANLEGTFARVLRLEPDDELRRAARAVLRANIVQGDALEMRTASGDPIVFPEWGYLGRGRFQRRDFAYESLMQRSSVQGTLFDALDEHDIFTPLRTYPSMSVKDLAA